MVACTSTRSAAPPYNHLQPIAEQDRRSATALMTAATMARLLRKGPPDLSAPALVVLASICRPEEPAGTQPQPLLSAEAVSTIGEVL